MTGHSSPTLQNTNIPFVHFGRRFDAEPTGQQLLGIYHELYSLAKATVDEFIAREPSAFALHPTGNGDSPISYNMGMTTEGMVIVPRRSEGTMLKRPDGSEIGFVALNGTTLGGTMMVKHQEEWDVLRSQRSKLDSILDTIGIPRVSETYKSHV
jgi:ATP adenylyltransferase